MRFGWTFSGSIFNNSDYLNSWITYPKAIEEPTNDFQQIGFFKKNQYITTILGKVTPFYPILETEISEKKQWTNRIFV